MPNYKAKKIILREYNNLNKQWELLYPKTTGDMIEGRVENARLLDGKEPKDFMPSTFSSYMKITDPDNKPQGAIMRGLVVSVDYRRDEVKAMNNSIWVNTP